MSINPLKLTEIKVYSYVVSSAQTDSSYSISLTLLGTATKFLSSRLFSSSTPPSHTSSPLQALHYHAPQRRIRLELVSVIDLLRETDHKQMFWEIRLYANRNVEFHNPMLELRGQARYDELLLYNFDDERSVESVLLKEELKDVGHYRKAIKRYREKYWNPIDTGDGPENWEKKAFVLEHEEAVREKSNAATGVPPKTPDEKVRQGLNRLETKLEELAKTIGETRDMVQAVGNAAAASTKLNPAQKRALSKSFEDQDYRKSQRISNEDTTALFPLAGGSENKMEVEEEGGDV